MSVMDVYSGTRDLAATQSTTQQLVYVKFASISHRTLIRKPLPETSILQNSRVIDHRPPARAYDPAFTDYVTHRGARKTRDRAIPATGTTSGGGEARSSEDEA